MPPRIAVIAGTRPEFIKLSKVVEELRRRGVEPTIIASGQHQSLLRGTPAESTMAPHISLNLPSDNDPIAYTGTCIKALQVQLAQEKPDLVIIQGDTASANAGSIAAHRLEIPSAHVEAGVRSGDAHDPYPEEMFRIHIDGLATHWLCATEANHENLKFHPDDKWEFAPIVTGNPGIDALYSHTKPTKEVQDHILVTLHRRESFGEPLDRILQGIYAAARRQPQIEFLWPIHPNPQVTQALERTVQNANDVTNVLINGPMNAVLFANTLSKCRGVITDSGGVQEEACALGIPCIVAREKTDRPESVEVGLAKVVGRTESGILEGLDWALGFTKRPDPNLVFGDGHAAPRIVQHLLEDL